MKGCKNCPAYAKCTVTYRGSACAALRSTYGIDSDPEIVTNADRLSAMSDEEKAKELTMLFYLVSQKTNAEHYILDWLQQPAEEDADGLRQTDRAAAERSLRERH